MNETDLDWRCDSMQFPMVAEYYRSTQGTAHVGLLRSCDSDVIELLTKKTSVYAGILTLLLVLFVRNFVARLVRYNPPPLSLLSLSLKKNL
jgi:hypothetical protein